MLAIVSSSIFKAGLISLMVSDPTQGDSQKRWYDYSRRTTLMISKSPDMKSAKST
jgi:hypothetical protein